MSPVLRMSRVQERAEKPERARNLRPPREQRKRGFPVNRLAVRRMSRLQEKLNVVREVFSSRKFPSMIAALKQAIAIYADDPAWRTVRPPLVELIPERAEMLARELRAIGFAMPGKRQEEG